jgi:hypothetical protein
MGRVAVVAAVPGLRHRAPHLPSLVAGEAPIRAIRVVLDEPAPVRAGPPQGRRNAVVTAAPGGLPRTETGPPALPPESLRGMDPRY